MILVLIKDLNYSTSEGWKVTRTKSNKPQIATQAPKTSAANQNICRSRTDSSYRKWEEIAETQKELQNQVERKASASGRKEKSRHFWNCLRTTMMVKRGWPQVKYKYKTNCAGSKSETEDPFLLLGDEKK